MRDGWNCWAGRAGLRPPSAIDAELRRQATVKSRLTTEGTTSMVQDIRRRWEAPEKTRHGAREHRPSTLIWNQDS